MKSSLLTKRGYTVPVELQKLDDEFGLDQAIGATYDRVVWAEPGSTTPPKTLKTNSLDQVGLASNKSLYPGLRAVHVGDADFWFEQLVDDYNRAPHAWVAEINPMDGDVITEDPQYKMPGIDGSKAASFVLITRRKELHEGIDFKYIRELTAEDLPETATSESDEY